MDSGLQALLAEGEAFELVQAVVFSCTARYGQWNLLGMVRVVDLLDHRVLQQCLLRGVVKDGGLCICSVVFQLPGVSSLVV